MVEAPLWFKTWAFVCDLPEGADLSAEFTLNCLPLVVTLPVTSRPFFCHYWLPVFSLGVWVLPFL